MKNKEITIYKLMGLIKDGKAPKKVFYNGSEYKFCKDIGDYRRLGWEHCLIIKDIFEYDEHFHNSLYNMLNDTVEILPEENDGWEDIEEIKNYPYIVSQDDVINTINQIIKNQRKIIEKLESKDE